MITHGHQFRREIKDDNRLREFDWRSIFNYVLTAQIEGELKDSIAVSGWIQPSLPACQSTNNRNNTVLTKKRKIH